MKRTPAGIAALLFRSVAIPFAQIAAPLDLELLKATRHRKKYAQGLPW